MGVYRTTTRTPRRASVTARVLWSTAAMACSPSCDTRASADVDAITLSAAR
jgi:hypothetical protein